MSSESTGAKKTLLFVDHTPFAGGAQLVLVPHFAALRDSDFEVVIACSDTVPSLLKSYQEAGAIVRVLPMPRLRGWGLVRSVRDIWQTVRQLRRLMQHEAVVVVVNSTRAGYFVWLAGIGLSTPVIWWVRDYLYPKALFTMLSGSVSRFIFVSQSIARFYGKLHDPRTAVLYVASNLHADLKRLTVGAKAQAKRDYGIDPHDVVIGFMGRLVVEKGAEDVIRAVSALIPEYPQVKLLIVGTGSGQQHDVEQYLHELVEEQGLSSSVKFTGFQPDQALHYSLFDIFVLPTRDHEPFATSVVQAMMAGAAVVGSDAGGTPELVYDGQTGLLFEPGNVNSLTNALRRLLSDPALCDRLAQAGKHRVLQYHTEEVLAEQAKQVYQSVLAP